jgi:hypothetical protein
MIFRAQIKKEVKIAAPSGSEQSLDLPTAYPAHHSI